MTPPLSWTWVRTTLSGLVAGASLALGSCGGEQAATTATGSAGRAGLEAEPTWSGGVADLIHRSCSTCHRPGEAAPFSLLTYEDARRRAKQLRIVTADGYMPPWLPKAEPGHFRGDRSLSADEIALLARWVESGAPRGDADAAPGPPAFVEGWQLGQPDLVVRMPESFLLPAEGRDLYRNFVIPRPFAGKRYVRAAEWRPDNRAVIHHAVLFIDRSGAALAFDRSDPTPGYGGMGPGPAEVPDGLFEGWAPGKQPRRHEEGMAWQLDEKTDIVLQLHMRPTGKPEPVNVEIGLYLTDEPPTKQPVGLRLMSFDIDIPAGAAEYRVSDEYRLPVPVLVHGVYPHAHYLGRDMRGFAVLPNKERVELFHIPRWDFNWQDDYAFERPIPLPSGALLRMEYTFDNSADNVLNPSDPPRRVRFGEQSDDEMAEMLLQVTANEGDLPRLWRDFALKMNQDQTAHALEMSRQEPGRPRWFVRLGELAAKAGRHDEAVEYAQRVVAMRPGRVTPLANLGHAYYLAGRLEEAVEAFRNTLALEERHLAARVELGRSYLELGRLTEAEVELQRAAADAPEVAEVHLAWGDFWLVREDAGAAETAFRRALACNSEETRAMTALAILLIEREEALEAVELLRTALRVHPDESQAHYLLGLAYEAAGDHKSALGHLDTARFLRSEPLYEAAYRRVQAALSIGG